jgi:hypothetical protein
MCRDPRDHNLVVLETGAFAIVGNDWHARLDKVFNENLGKFRKYDGKSVQDLLRALRNKVSLFVPSIHPFRVPHARRGHFRNITIKTSLTT